MRQKSNVVESKPCRRCKRRCQSARRVRLCERCEKEYIERRKSIALSFWKALGYTLIVPLIVLTWNTASPFGESMVFGHIWLVILGVFAGEYLSRKLSAARLVLLRHRFEQEDEGQLHATLSKGRHEV